MDWFLVWVILPFGWLAIHMFYKARAQNHQWLMDKQIRESVAKMDGFKLASIEWTSMTNVVVRIEKI